MKKLITLIILLAASLPVSARFADDGNTELYERVYVQTDKDFYLSGELVWLKMITTTERGIPLNFSKVGYVQLLDAAGSKSQAMLPLIDGKGNGSLLLPADLPTGCYRLIGYTRYQRNESPDVYFEKIIGIVNPLFPEVYALDSDQPDRFPASQRSTVSGQSGIRLSTDRSLLGFRNRVEVRLDDLPQDIHTLSIAVTAADYTHSYSQPGMAQWKSALAPAGPWSGEFMAEYEGHTVNGRLIEVSTGKPAFSYSVVPLIAFPGNDIQLFSGHIDSLGHIAFHTRRADGFSDIVTTLAGANPRDFEIELHSPYASDYPAKTLPMLDVSTIDKDALVRQSVGLQVQYSYVADSLLFFDYPLPHFFYAPDHSYIMEEYRKFGTMEEVMIEFVTFARFHNVNRKRYLGILREEYGYGNPNTLVLIDGIPIFDHSIVAAYNPLLLERIDTYYEPFVIGGLRYDGVIALYTEKNLAPELAPDPYTRIISYDSPQAPREFHSPDYSFDLESKRHMPDFRHTLYWNPEINTQGRTALTLPFYTSDLPGTYRITVEGITREGKVVYATSDFRVQ